MKCTSTTFGYGGEAAKALCHSGNTLPFTGLNLITFVAVAAALIVVGLLLRKRGAKS